MMYRQLICDQVAWLPEPAEIPVGDIPVKEGKNLPNSIEEDVRNFSLAPTYSSKQLRHIKRLHQRRLRDVRKLIRYQKGGNEVT